MVTRDGRVKILDFGLALRRRTSQDSTTMDMTDEGTMLGTAGYMSPEQVRGEQVDHRSDLFSFGVILYEMLGGKRAFSGGSSVEVMSAILKEDPPELPASVPPVFDRIMRRCLQKDREQRFQTAADLLFALQFLPHSPTPDRTAQTPRVVEMGGPWGSRHGGNCLLLAGSAPPHPLCAGGIRTPPPDGRRRSRQQRGHFCRRQIGRLRQGRRYLGPASRQ